MVFTSELRNILFNHQTLQLGSSCSNPSALHSIAMHTLNWRRRPGSRDRNLSAYEPNCWVLWGSRRPGQETTIHICRMGPLTSNSISNKCCTSLKLCWIQSHLDQRHCHGYSQSSKHRSNWCPVEWLTTNKDSWRPWNGHQFRNVKDQST